jgi:hypothetical protein
MLPRYRSGPFWLITRELRAWWQVGRNFLARAMLDARCMAEATALMREPLQVSREPLQDGQAGWLVVRCR